MMVGLGRDGTLGVTVPNDNVRVGANSNAALLWVHVEDLGSIGTSDRNKLAWGQLARNHAFGPHNPHAVLNAVHPVGDLGEIVLPHSLLVSVESAIIGPNDLQITTCQHIHQVIPDCGVRTEGWAHNMGCSVAPALVECVCPVRSQSCCDWFPVHPLTGFAPQTNHVSSTLGHDVHNVDRGVDTVSYHDGTVRGLGLQILRT
mmetsp:Transcript_29009/g.52090  ORF Transcript_29009/g.52090 Transcript_29009/m.52090 type:complete len:202 (+) Transcript_29009:1044-1649(+)